jgi:apolipoprotein N-acyltransferase
MSVIVSARGEELARHDPFASGPGVIVTDLPVYDRRSLYAYLGNWVAGVALLLLGVGAALERRAASATRAAVAKGHPSDRR